MKFNNEKVLINNEINNKPFIIVETALFCIKILLIFPLIH